MRLCMYTMNMHANDVCLGMRTSVDGGTEGRLMSSIARTIVLCFN